MALAPLATNRKARKRHDCPCALDIQRYHLTMLNGPTVKMLCQSCNRTGAHAFGDLQKPRFCRCKAGKVGPIVAAPGTIVCFRFGRTDDTAFREQCRLASNAERRARDVCSLRFVKIGEDYRELPPMSPKRQRHEKAYAAAIAALEALQAICPHEDRSHYAPEHCDCCHAHVESDIAQHRHLVREGFYDDAAAE